MYYGGYTVSIASVFSTVDEIDGIKIERIFGDKEVLNYEAYPVAECPFCKQNQRIEAMVNGFGYSKL